MSKTTATFSSTQTKVTIDTLDNAQQVQARLERARHELENAEKEAQATPGLDTANRCFQKTPSVKTLVTDWQITVKRFNTISNYTYEKCPNGKTFSWRRRGGSYLGNCARDLTNQHVDYQKIQSDIAILIRDCHSLLNHPKLSTEEKQLVGQAINELNLLSQEAAKIPDKLNAQWNSTEHPQVHLDALSNRLKAIGAKLDPILNKICS